MQNNPNYQYLTYINLSSFSPANPELQSPQQLPVNNVPIQSRQQLSDLIPAIRALRTPPALRAPPADVPPATQELENNPLDNHPAENSSTTFTDVFVDPGVCARPAGIKTCVQRLNGANVFAESSSLYCPHHHFLCHSFDYDCFVNLPWSIHVRVQVLNATTKQEVFKDEKPIFGGQVETIIHLQRPVDCNSVGAKFIKHEEKFQLLDCSYHHSKSDFMLSVSYRLTKDGEPFLVRQSPHFTCFARGPSKRKRAVGNAENENEIEAKKQRVQAKAVPMTRSDKVPSAQRLPISVPSASRLIAPAPARRLQVPVSTPVPLSGAPNIVSTGSYTLFEQDETVVLQPVIFSLMAKFAELIRIAQELPEEQKKYTLGCMKKVLNDVCGQEDSRKPTQLQGYQGLPSFRQQNDVYYHVDYQPIGLESRGSNILSGSNFMQQLVTTNLEGDQDWDNLHNHFCRQENADCYEQNPQESPVIYLSPLNTNDWQSNILDSP